MNPDVTVALAVTVIAVALTGWRALRGIEEIEAGWGAATRFPLRAVPDVPAPAGRPQLSLIVGSAPASGGRRHRPGRSRPLHLVDPTPAA